MAFGGIISVFLYYCTAVLVFCPIQLEASSTPILTIQSPDGDMVGCFDPTSQPAFDHPLLKNHTFQERPSNMPYMVGEEQWGWQVWHRNGTKCPQGSIPLRNLTSQFNATKSNAADDSPTQGHEYAVGSLQNDSTIYGTQATMNVWRPKIEEFGEFSLGQIWLRSGSYETNDVNTVEAGWQVFPMLYLDDQPRFFVYWTTDSYNHTGCYNIRCPGFVQTSSTVLVEGAIARTSVFGGSQADLTIKIWKDSKLESWWLGILLDNGVITPVGYWPAILFTLMDDYATIVQWGSEIINQNVIRHTKTEMGSGYFPDSGFGKAAYMSNLEIAMSENNFERVHDLLIGASHPDYYRVKTSKIGALGTHFLYGGSLQVQPTLHAGAVDLSLDSTFLFLYLSIVFVCLVFIEY